ncbi:ligase [Prevotella histicola]
MSKKQRYFLFSLSLFITQILGTGIVPMGLFALSVLLIVSPATFICGLRNTPLFLLFIFLSIGIGAYFGLCNGLKPWNIAYWGQFYFLCIFLLGVKDKEKCLEMMRYFVFIIFILDFGTNLLFLIGFNVPWAELPPVRPGESLARFPGFKGNALYSGSITFVSMCYILNQKKINKITFYFGLTCMVGNLILSGSYRYLIIGAVVATMYYLHLYRSKLMMLGMYVSSIIIVFVSTLMTMFSNLSNFYRAFIWFYFFKEIGKSPWIGYGFFNIHLDENQDFSTPSHLIANGVTESCILTIGYSFGLIVLLFFLTSIVRTLLRYKVYRKYSVELGLFIGLTLDLFWGGSFDNTYTFTLLLLSWYLVNERFYKGQKDENILNNHTDI